MLKKKKKETWNLIYFLWRLILGLKCMGSLVELSTRVVSPLRRRLVLVTSSALWEICSSLFRENGLPIYSYLQT